MTPAPALQAPPLPMMPPSPAAVDPYDLKPFGEALKTLIREKILTVVDSARQQYLIMALRNELYWRGKQYLTMKFIGGEGITVVPATGVPGAPQTPGTPQTSQALAYTFNITRGDGQKFIAVTGARPPYVNIEPQDPRDPESVQASRDGDATSRYLEELWDTKGKQSDVARTIWRTGPQFANVCWVADEDKYGAADVHSAQLVDKADPSTLTCPACGFTGPADEGTPPGPASCPQCGSLAAEVAPGASYQSVDMVKTGTQPKGMPELHFYNIFEVTIPPQRKDIKSCEWLVNEVLEVSGKIRQQYGDLVKDIKDETPSGVEVPSQESMADHYDVIASADLQHRNRQDRWWHTRVFLKPEMYHYAPADLKKVLQEGYPSGARVVLVNGNFVQGVAENLEDVWIVCKTGTDDRILSDPICHDLVPVNTILNDFFNLGMEIVLRAVPKTIVNPRLIDRKAIQANSANPYEILFANTGLSEDLGKMMHSLPQSSFSEQMIELANLFRQYSRELDGALEAIFGGGEPAPTWRQEQQRKNQALAQFYIAYNEMRMFWEQAHRLAHKLLAKFGVGEISVPTDEPFRFGPRVVDFTKLRPDLIRVEADEKMPETSAEEEDRLAALFAEPPQVQEAAGVFHPVNVPRVVGLVSMRGFTSPLEHLTIKTLKIIEQLIGQQPIQQFDPMTGAPMIDPMTGQPVEQPSIAPDPFEFKNAAYAVEIVRAFVNSPAGGEYNDQSPDGFRNVRLFGNALEQMSMQQQMAAAMVPAPGAAPAPPAAPAAMPQAA